MYSTLGSAPLARPIVTVTVCGVIAGLVDLDSSAVVSIALVSAVATVAVLEWTVSRTGRGRRSCQSKKDFHSAAVPVSNGPSSTQLSRSGHNSRTLASSSVTLITGVWAKTRLTVSDRRRNRPQRRDSGLKSAVHSPTIPVSSSTCSAHDSSTCSERPAPSIPSIRSNSLSENRTLSGASITNSVSAARCCCRISSKASDVLVSKGSCR